MVDKVKSDSDQTSQLLAKCELDLCTQEKAMKHLQEKQSKDLKSVAESIFDQMDVVRLNHSKLVKSTEQMDDRIYEQLLYKVSTEKFDTVKKEMKTFVKHVDIEKYQAEVADLNSQCRGTLVQFCREHG